MFDMVSRRGFVSLSAVAAAGLGLAGCSGSKTSEPAGSDAGSAKASSKKETVELQVFAANSLEKALPEVQELYTDQTGTTFADTQFKASGDLVEQMRAGAAVDVLITASKGTMDDAEAAELVDVDTREDMFVNDLVIIRAEGSDTKVEAIADVANLDGKIAIGDAKTVPAGKTHTIIGVSGTVTTMTALAMGLTEYDHTAVDGARCTLEDAYAVDNRFLHMPREERLTYKTIHPGRVDVVGGGALVWNRVLAKVSEAAYEDHGQRIDSFMASEHGLLDGIVLDYGKRLLAAR